jgi:hypothetical protein
MTTAPSLITNGNFYPAYQKVHADFSVDTFACAERTVLRLLETHPSAEHPGMLLGKVQSGKTRTFITILTLAFDNGFDVAIILTKSSTALVKQTFQRIQEEFAPFIADDLLDVYDVMALPAALTRYELGKKLIFVAKKETNNLDRLIDLFGLDSNAPGLHEKGVLILDDEADFASVSFSRPGRGEPVQAATIPVKISNLRSLLPRGSLLQVTATPYSLYLQPTDTAVPNAPDFRPLRPAFTELVPVPDTYIGGSFYFGNEARNQEEDSIQRRLHHVVSERELTALKKSDGRRLKLEEVLISPSIPALRRAVVNFITGGTIRRLQEEHDGGTRRSLKFSFLIHTEQARAAHEWQDDVVSNIVKLLTTTAEQELSIFEDLIRESFDDLAASITVSGGRLPDFSHVRSAVRCALSAGHVMITKVNSDEQVAAMLDQSGQLKLRCPFNIFIGGQVIDRGITLGGLIGFYYGRRPQRFQQDTVLQHSRMFGYRSMADLAVTRFYTLNHLLQALYDIEDFDCALRSAISAGGDQSVQFIRRHPQGQIIPCSPNKILLSNITTLRPHSRHLPLGFQTGYKSHIESTVTEVDQILDQRSDPANREAPFLVPLDVAVDLIRRIYSTLKFEEDYTSNEHALVAALTHLSTGCSDQAVRGKIHLIVRTGRTVVRIRESGRPTNAPDSQHREGRIARQVAQHTPALILLRQEGREEDGWRGAPFYWPVVLTPANCPTTIFSADVRSNLDDND